MSGKIFRPREKISLPSPPSASPTYILTIHFDLAVFSSIDIIIENTSGEGGKNTAVCGKIDPYNRPPESVCCPLTLNSN
jgi:hypothetical protein